MILSMLFCMFLSINETEEVSINTIVSLETNYGEIIIELYDEKTPKTVENFVKYVTEGFYDGIIFHRVINNFMIQTGGFLPGLENKEPTYPSIINESTNSCIRNLKGTISMARTNDPNSATSQFFINSVDNHGLDWDKCSDGWGYCAFGKVTEGFDIVNSIQNVKTHSVGHYDDVPIEDIIIIKASVVEM